MQVQHHKRKGATENTGVDVEDVALRRSTQNHGLNIRVLSSKERYGNEKKDQDTLNHDGNLIIRESIENYRDVRNASHGFQGKAQVSGNTSLETTDSMEHVRNLRDVIFSSVKVTADARNDSQSFHDKAYEAPKSYAWAKYLQDPRYEVKNVIQTSKDCSWDVNEGDLHHLRRNRNVKVAEKRKGIPVVGEIDHGKVQDHGSDTDVLTWHLKNAFARFKDQHLHNMNSSQYVDQQSIDQVLWSLNYGMGESRIQAAKEIRNLAKDSGNKRTYLAAAGVIAPLVSMLKSTSLEAKEAALLALLNLAVRNEKNKVRIVGAGVIAHLAELMESGSPSLMESAAATILTLSASNANKPVLGASALVPQLVKMLTSGSLQGKVDAVMAFYNLSTCRENLMPMLAAGAGNPLIALLKTCKKSSKVAEKLIALVESMMDFEEGRSCVMQHEGGMLAIVEVLEDGTLQGREHAVGALLTMCESNEVKYKAAILQEGAIPGLLELTVQGSKQAQQKAQTLLKLLRDRREAVQAGEPLACASTIIETLVYDIASHVDNAGGSTGKAGTARKMLTEMVQMSIENGMLKLQHKPWSAHGQI